RDLMLGILAFIALVGPVLSIQTALTQFWPSEHPIIDLLKKSETTLPFFCSYVAAVFIAPPVEEFLFRVVLQGWLERLAVDWRGALGGRFTPEPTEEEVNDRPRKSWPIVVSSALFALAHVGHGPDWVALFVLGLGLGYLYRQTHRLWPSMIVHLLLNGWS